jgi:hypothetical protein
MKLSPSTSPVVVSKFLAALGVPWRGCVFDVGAGWATGVRVLRLPMTDQPARPGEGATWYLSDAGKRAAASQRWAGRSCLKPEVRYALGR